MRDMRRRNKSPTFWILATMAFVGAIAFLMATSSAAMGPSPAASSPAQIESTSITSTANGGAGLVASGVLMNLKHPTLNGSDTTAMVSGAGANAENSNTATATTCRKNDAVVNWAPGTDNSDFKKKSSEIAKTSANLEEATAVNA
jgi:hypothetical protein